MKTENGFRLAIQIQTLFKLKVFPNFKLIQHLNPFEIQRPKYENKAGTLKSLKHIRKLSHCSRAAIGPGTYVEK